MGTQRHREKTLEGQGQRLEWHVQRPGLTTDYQQPGDAKKERHNTLSEPPEDQPGQHLDFEFLASRSEKRNFGSLKKIIVYLFSLFEVIACGS